MTLKFCALPTGTVRKLQNGGPDANGQRPESLVSDGSDNPCRHCLTDIPTGMPMLVLAYRPFAAPQPYAEVGPIFLCGEPCERYVGDSHLPELFQGWGGKIMLRGYDDGERIVYGTGQVVDMPSVETIALQVFSSARVRFIHLRSASNNCYQCRIERA